VLLLIGPHFDARENSRTGGALPYALVPEQTKMVQQEIGPRLLDYLREAMERPSLTYSEAPTSLAGGFENSVFGFRLNEAPPSLSGSLVLRLFGESQSSERARL